MTMTITRELEPFEYAEETARRLGLEEAHEAIFDGEINSPDDAHEAARRLGLVEECNALLDA